MPRKFDKKSAKTFSVVHRAHDDSLYFDNDASAHVLVPAPSRKLKKNQPIPSLTTEKYDASKKVYSTAELAQKLDPEEIKAIRANEGLAAQYGIYFDDSNYDYMQHLKPLGETQDAVFIDAKNPKPDNKNKNVEDLFKDQLPSDRKRNVTHDDFENVPEEFKGFNPDLDPRLREILEALDDEAYIEESAEQDGNDDGEDVFAALLGSGEVEDEDEFYYGSDADQYYDDDYDEWDLDNYQEEYDAKYDSDNLEDYEKPFNAGEAPEDEVVAKPTSGWERDFNKFKAESKNKQNDWDSDDDFEEEDEVPELPTITNLKKQSKTKLRKKKGAMTDTSSFSMSSSALFRTEGLTLLDDRYEQLNKKFEQEEEEENYENFDMSKERGDLEDMLDDFLDNYELANGGRTLTKKNEEAARVQKAADSVSRSKVAAKRKRQAGLNNLFANMSL